MKTILNIEKEEFNVKSFADRRKRVHRIVVSYLDKETGFEFRKKFEYPASFNSIEMENVRLSLPKTI